MIHAGPNGLQDHSFDLAAREHIHKGTARTKPGYKHGCGLKARSASRQHPHASFASGVALSSVRRRRQVGRWRSMRPRNLSSWVGTRRWVSSWTSTYSRQAAGFLMSGAADTDGESITSRPRHGVTDRPLRSSARPRVKGRASGSCVQLGRRRAEPTSVRRAVAARPPTW